MKVKIYSEVCRILFYEVNQDINGQDVLIILNVVTSFQDIQNNSSINSTFWGFLILNFALYSKIEDIMLLQPAMALIDGG